MENLNPVQNDYFCFNNSSS